MKKTSRKNRKYFSLPGKFLLPLVLLALLIPSTLLAYETKTASSVFIAQDETIEGNLYTAGQSITVEGNIKGDLICGAQTILINGQIDGDVICGAQTIVINGIVGGNVRVAAETITMNGQVAKNTNLLGLSIISSPNASFGQDVLLLGETADVSGNISGTLHGALANLSLNASVAKDVKFRFANRDYDRKNNFGDQTSAAYFKIGDNTDIGGNLYYQANSVATIAPAANISGDTSYSRSELPSKTNSSQRFYWGWLFSIFSSLMIGLVIISLWRNMVTELISSKSTNFWSAIGRGSILMFLTPFVIILLVLTIIGLPLALIITTLWIISFYLASIVTSIFIGNQILNNLPAKNTENKKDSSLIWSMVVGVIVFQAISSIPFFGWLLSLLAIWWGLGSAWLYFKKSNY